MVNADVMIFRKDGKILKVIVKDGVTWAAIERGPLWEQYMGKEEEGKNA